MGTPAVVLSASAGAYKTKPMYAAERKRNDRAAAVRMVRDEKRRPRYAYEVVSPSSGLAKNGMATYAMKTVART